MNGVLVIDKPKGWTSHDVVARVRRILRVKKAGHGGTLDPLATGVLPIYLNEGTKLVPFNLEGTKEYIATMKLGQETNTLDADGEIVAESKGFSCTPQEIEEVLERFRGVILQVPPLFSAIKLDGLPLYKRARWGEKPLLRAREVVIHSLGLKDFSYPLATVSLTCGRGTYVRTLGADIGRALGCGAYLVELRRVRSGKFSLEQALSLDELTQLVEQGKAGDRIIPLKDGVDIASEIRVERGVAERVRQGRPLHLGDLPRGDWDWLKSGQKVRLLHSADQLLAIAESRVDEVPALAESRQVLRTLRVFHD